MTEPGRANKLTVAGMLEVVQRTEIPFDAREGSLRFVRVWSQYRRDVERFRTWNSKQVDVGQFKRVLTCEICVLLQNRPSSYRFRRLD